MSPAELDHVAAAVADALDKRLSQRPEPILVDRHALAEAIGLSVATIDRRVRDASITPIRVGNRVLFDRHEVVAQLKTAKEV